MSTTTTDTNIQTISTQELHQKLQNKQSFEFWNVLTDEYFKGENISGSHRVPLDKVGNEVRQAGIAKNADIVVYCAGPHCPQSRLAAEKLVKLGYDNVRAYEGGLEEWKQAGYGIDKV
ncbi:MAG TPA: rhodanese-like domain-containing protein [Terriglobales bacterium]